MADIFTTSPKMKAQLDEFNAVAALAEQWRRLSLTPIVDDDYPSVRADYERAINAVVEACAKNGRCGVAV